MQRLFLTTILINFNLLQPQRYPQENKLRKITTLSPPPRLRGPEGDNLTLNKFIKNFDSKPSISVDLEDFQKFPTLVCMKTYKML